MSLNYTTLHTTRDEIRLLRFSTPLDSATRVINCTLEVVSLNSDPLPEYVALSYMWGPGPDAGKPLFEVRVDDVSFSVTENLMLALFFLNTRCGMQSPVWIDAICINQGDSVERGQQVTLMRRIYSQASCVWAWLIPFPNCDLGMDLIEAAAQHVVGRPAGKPWPLISRDWLVRQIYDPQMSHTWNGFVKILQQPYWSRNWIVQELFVGRRLMIICGERIASLDLLWGICFGLADITLDGIARSKILTDALTNSPEVTDIALLLISGSAPLSSLLRRFADSNATDPRDKVYSLVGIATPYPGTLFAIDYTVGWPQVFSRATRYLIEGDYNMDILGASASGSSELPSWVPDFAGQGMYQLDPDLDEVTPNVVAAWTTNYCAGGSTMPLARFSDDGTLLTAKVIFVHSLSSILPLRHFGEDHSPIDELTRRLRFLLENYSLSANRRANMPESVPLELGVYVCLRFYLATFLTAFLSSMVGQVWPVQDFVSFGMRCIRGNGRATNCTEAQLDLLRSVLTPYRSLFSCELKEPFSLEEDFRKARGDDIANIDPGVFPALRNCKFQVPAYCRNLRDLGQNGDIVSIVLGCNMPLLLRPVSKPGEFPLVMRVMSEAYVYGIMDGEALGKFPECEVTLV